jgi:hypothetical protein
MAPVVCIVAPILIGVAIIKLWRAYHEAERVELRQAAKAFKAGRHSEAQSHLQSAAIIHNQKIDAKLIKLNGCLEKVRAKNRTCAIGCLEKKIAKLEAKRLPLEEYLNNHSNNNNNNQQGQQGQQGVSAIPLAFQTATPTVTYAAVPIASAPIIQSPSINNTSSNNPVSYYPTLNSAGSNYVQLRDR